MVLKRYDWKDMIEKQFKKIWFLKLMTWLTRNLKDMIQTLNISQQKRQHTWNVESNHQLIASIFENGKKLILKRYDWKDMIWKRFDFEKFWKLEKKIWIKNRIFPLVPSWR